MVGKSETTVQRPQTAVELADAAVQAITSDRTRATIADLARDWATRRVVDPVPFEATVLPAWEIEVIGAVRRAARYGNLFLDAVDAGVR